MITQMIKDFLATIVVVLIIVATTYIMVVHTSSAMGVFGLVFVMYIALIYCVGLFTQPSEKEGGLVLVLLLISFVGVPILAVFLSESLMPLYCPLLLFVFALSVWVHDRQV